jgi:hypothetical protein
MGYSISETQFQKLQRLEAEGRRCDMATGRGGCFRRAIYRQTQESWPYHLDEGARMEHTFTMCSTHALAEGSEGVNFRVLSLERF